jgi:hypothetical protein
MDRDMPTFLYISAGWKKITAQKKFNKNQAYFSFLALEFDFNFGILICQDFLK